MVKYKMGLLSVNGLLVTITDKMDKNSSLSVDLREILAKIDWAVLLLEKVVFIHLELKKPDKVSRKSTAFVWLFV